MKIILYLLLSFVLSAQKSTESFPVFENPQAKNIFIDSVIILIRELKTKSSISYGEAVDFYYLKIASSGKNQWIEKLEEFSMDPTCPAKLKDKINAQIEKIRTLQIGEKVPEIRIDDFQLSTYQPDQEYFLLLFYSPSCFHCTELLIDLIPYSEKIKLPVIALQIDDEMNPWHFPEFWTLLKADAKIRKDYGVFSTPSLYLVNTKSKQIRAIPENLSEIKEFELLF
jgi:thioredoxin-related protein